MHQYLRCPTGWLQSSLLRSHVTLRTWPPARLQSELAASEAAIPGRPAGPPPAARVANLRERLVKVNRQAAEVEVSGVAGPGVTLGCPGCSTRQRQHAGTQSGRQLEAGRFTRMVAHPPGLVGGAASLSPPQRSCYVPCRAPSCRVAACVCCHMLPCRCLTNPRTHRLPHRQQPCAAPAGQRTGTAGQAYVAGCAWHDADWQRRLTGHVAYVPPCT